MEYQISINHQPLNYKFDIKIPNILLKDLIIQLERQLKQPEKPLEQISLKSKTFNRLLQLDKYIADELKQITHDTFDIIYSNQNPIIQLIELKISMESQTLIEKFSLQDQLLDIINKLKNYSMQHSNTHNFDLYFIKDDQQIQLKDLNLTIQQAGLQNRSKIIAKIRYLGGFR